MSFPRFKSGCALRRAALAAAVLAAGATAVVADEVAKVFVNVASVEVRTGKGPSSATVDLVRKGAPLQVLAREGKWLKVQTPTGKQGYVFEGSVTDTAGSGAGTNDAAKVLLGGPEASASSNAEAFKQLGPDAKKYAMTKGMKTADADKLLAQRDQDVSAQWEKFTKEGKVGPDQPH